MHVHLCVDKYMWVQMSAEPRRGFGFSGVGVAWGCKAAQITLRMSARTASAHNHRATSPAPQQLLFIKISKDQCWCCKPVMQLVFNNFYISQGFCNSVRDSFSHSDFHTSCVFLNNKISFTDFFESFIQGISSSYSAPISSKTPSRFTASTSCFLHLAADILVLWLLGHFWHLFQDATPA